MPHLFVDRPRLFDLVDRRPSPQDQLRWETVNTTVYLVGGVLFVWGSVLFFPRLEAHSDRGAWIFFVGSLLYVLVAGHDTTEVVRHRRQQPQPSIWDRFEAWAAMSYLLGSTLFAAGSIFFLSVVGWYQAGAICFVVGSLLFVLGATVNVLQILEAENRRTLQLMNLTALTYVTGSVLFTVASIPYLFTLDPADERTIDSFLAGQYVAGSLLFLLGGVINYRRAHIVGRHSQDTAVS
jgi:hypothetical protein